MQKLDSRNTYTPTDISHVRSNCDSSLKDPGGRVGVADLKTDSNNLDATLTAKEQAGQNKYVFAVYVLNKRGKPLMPTSPGKAKKLLQERKARVVKLFPFTVQLLIATGETKQEIVLGIDSGYSHIGLSAISKNKEVYAAEVNLRKDLVKLNAERAMYRRSRRSRKVWHRKPRFLNRKKKNLVAPSIQHKIDSHKKVIEELQKILPITKFVVEVAAFDIQKIKNPEITKEEYKSGEQLGFCNVREYVLHRDNHTCMYCKGKSKDPVLQVHHLISRQIGGDRPENLVSLCKTCHQNFHKGKIKLTVKPKNGFKAESFMSIQRLRFMHLLKEQGYNIFPTYGYVTKAKRISLGLEKSHVTDAFIIAGGGMQLRQKYPVFIKQVRRCNRKLFKGIRSHIKNTSHRFIEGFQRFDKVIYNGIECFVFGRRKTGYFDLRKLNGLKIHSSAKAKDCRLLERFKTLLTEKGGSISSLT